MSKPAKYLKPREVVERWGGAVVLQTLANWRTQGRGPAFVKFGVKVMYPIDALEQYESSNAHLMRAGNDNNTEREGN